MMLRPMRKDIDPFAAGLRPRRALCLAINVHRVRKMMVVVTEPKWLVASGWWPGFGGVE